MNETLKFASDLVPYAIRGILLSIAAGVIGVLTALFISVRNSVVKKLPDEPIEVGEFRAEITTCITLGTMSIIMLVFMGDDHRVLLTVAVCMICMIVSLMLYETPRSRNSS
jgi:hypothetical protein